MAGAESEQGNLGSAIFDAAARRDWLQAMRLVETNWSLLSDVRVDLIGAVADALPEELLDAHPQWQAIRAYIARRRTPDALRSPDYIDLVRTDRAHESPIATIAAATSQAAAARTIGQFSDAALHADEALAAYNAAEDAGAAIARSGAGELHDEWALSYLLADRISDAMACYTTAYSLAIGVGDLRIASRTAAGSAFVAALAGDGYGAARWLAAFRSAHSGRGDFATIGTLAQLLRQWDAYDFDGMAASIAALEGRTEDELRVLAASCIALASASMPGANARVLLSALDVELTVAGERRSASMLNGRLSLIARAECLTVLGQQRRALRDLERDSTASNVGTLSRRASLTLLLEGPERALPIARAAVKLGERLPRVRIGGYLVLAAAQLQLGMSDAAADSFRRGLALSEEHVVRTPLTLISQGSLSTLYGMAGYDAESDLAAVADASLPFPPSGHIGRLTRQELRVAQMLVAGKSRRDVAAQLDVSENTVKTHTSALYRKLHVTNRAQLTLELRCRGLQ